MLEKGQRVRYGESCLLPREVYMSFSVIAFKYVVLGKSKTLVGV